MLGYRNTLYAIFIGILIIYFIYKCWKYNHLIFKKLPGPKSFPILVNIFDIRKERVFEDIENLSWKYGNLYKLNLMGKEILILSDADEIIKILKERPDNFSRGEATHISSNAFRISGLFSDEGEEWKASRKLFAPELTVDKVKNMKKKNIKIMFEMGNDIDIYLQEIIEIKKKWMGSEKLSFNKNHINFDPKELPSIEDLIIKVTAKTGANIIFNPKLSIKASEEFGKDISDSAEIIFSRIFSRPFLWPWINKNEKDKRFILISRNFHKFISSNEEEFIKHMENEKKFR